MKSVIDSSRLQDYLTLTKPPIILLLWLTALGGMFMAAEGAPSGKLLVAVLAGGGMTAGGASAINHWLDRDIDRIMRRTRNRPLPRNSITPSQAILFGVALNIVGFALLAILANLLSAALAIGASLFYVLVYTWWLKRSTPQNIVIGGAAGAMPPVIGIAAVSGVIDLSAFYLFTIIFLWTPPHFWALSLMLKDDYHSAGIPMLPVVQGERATGWNIFLYTLALIATTLLLFPSADMGMVYLSTALLLGFLFFYFSLRVLSNPGREMALSLYKYSLLYLGGLFAAIMIDSLV